MSQSPSNSFFPLLAGPFGFGGSGFPVTQDEVTVAIEPVAPQEGVRRANYGPSFGGQYGPLPPYDGYLGPHLGVCGLPGGFGGFDAMPALSVPIMWAMRATPAIVLASNYLTFAPALSAPFSQEIVDDGGDPALADAVKAAATQDLLPMWDRAFPGALECLHFAHWLQEIVWGRREDRGSVGGEAGSTTAGGFRVVPTEVRPVLPMEATVHRDPYMRFAGFQIGEAFRAPSYAFLAVNQPHLDPVRGYSRNQNALRDWWRAMQSEKNADRTERKASGIHMMLGVPTGEMKYTDASGQVKTVTGHEMAQRIADQAAKANVFTVPRTFFSKESIERDPKLADIKAVSVDQFDWGDIGQSILAHLKRLDRLDVNMVRAWCHGEREGMEAEHGSRADAMAHKSGGVLDCEGVRKMLAQQWDDQVGLTWQRQNFPQWKGRLVTKPAPLADPLQEYLQKIAVTLLGSPATGPDTELELDKRANLERTSLALRPIEEVQKDRDQQKVDEERRRVDQANAAKNNAVQNNGNGNGNGLSKRVALGMTRIAARAGRN